MVEMANRRLRSEFFNCNENVGGDDGNGVGGDGDQNQDKPGKLLQEGMGKRRRAGTIDSDSECFDFKRISLFVTLYFIALDFPYLLKHISQLDT